MLKIKITSKTEQGIKIISNGKNIGRGEKVIQKIAGIKSEQVSDNSVMVIFPKFNITIAPMLIRNYHKVFEKLGAIKDVDYEIEVVKDEYDLKVV